MDYMIPKNVNSRFEFFEGVGWREVLFTMLGIAMGFLLFFILSLIIKSIMAKIVLSILPPIIAFVGSKADPRTNKSIFGFLKDFNKFKRSQNRYFYRFGRGRVNV